MLYKCSLLSMPCLTPTHHKIDTRRRKPYLKNPIGQLMVERKNWNKVGVTCSVIELYVSYLYKGLLFYLTKTSTQVLAL